MKIKIFDKYAKKKEGGTDLLLPFKQQRVKFLFVLEDDSITFTYKNFNISFSGSKNVYYLSKFKITRIKDKEFLLEYNDSDKTSFELEDAAILLLLFSKRKEIYLVYDDKQVLLYLILTLVITYFIWKKL